MKVPGRIKKGTASFVRGVRLVYKSSPRLSILTSLVMVFQGVLPLVPLYAVKRIVDAVSGENRFSGSASGYNPCGRGPYSLCPVQYRWCFSAADPVPGSKATTCRGLFRRSRRSLISPITRCPSSRTNCTGPSRKHPTGRRRL